MPASFISFNSNALAHYASSLGISTVDQALHALGSALAANPGWAGFPKVALVLRPTPYPLIAVLNRFDEAGKAWLEAQARDLAHACRSLRFVSYAQAELDCQRLAENLLSSFSSDELKRFSFTAIPRGGLFVLGMLAYILGLEREKLTPPYPPGIPLVVVDDCALTGARFGRFLNTLDNPNIIFAHLYSNSQLRNALQASEPRVLACFTARELHDFAPELHGNQHAAWQKRWLERLAGPRYWIGKLEHVCFAWGEPQRTIWNPVTHKAESAWRVVPPEMCLSNRTSPDNRLPAIQFQPAVQGALRPSTWTIFGELNEEVVIGNVKTGKCFELSGVAADIWRALVETGNVVEARQTLLAQYHVDEANLQADLDRFLDELLAQEFLERKGE